MAYVLTIAGVAKNLQQGWSIQETANGPNTFTGAIVSADASYRPAIDAEVLLTESGVRIFGGLISTPSEAGVGGYGLTPIVTTVGAVDFNSFASGTYLNTTIVAGNLKAALTVVTAALAAHGVTLHASQVNGPTLPVLAYPYWRIDDVLNQLTDLSGGYVWNIDYSKVLRMQLPASDAAPFSVTDTNDKALGDIASEVSRRDYANRITVLAGEGLASVTDSFTGTGSQTVFTLLYPLSSHAGYVTSAGVFEPIGVTTPPYWVYDPVANTITRTSAPALGAAITITYAAQFPVRVSANALDGSYATNPVERIVTEPQVFDVAVALLLATAYVATSSATPKTVRYRTRETGIHPGQSQTITSTMRNLSGTFLITDVTIQNPGDNFVEREVTARSVLGDSWRDYYKGLGGGGAGPASGSGGIVYVGGAAGSGTANKIAKWLTSSTLGDSIISDNGTVATVAGGLLISGSTAATLYKSASGGVALVGQTGSLYDFSLWSPTPTLIASVPTGTINVRFNGIIFAGAGLTLEGGTFAAGTLYISSGLGLAIGGFTGATNDFTILSPAAATIMRVPTGTVNAVFGGTVTATVFSGSGASLTSIPAGQLTGTITSATQDLITRTGTLVAGATGAGFTIALTTSTVTGNLPYARMPSGSGTWTATPTISGATIFQSTVEVDGNFSVATTKFTVAAVSGNTVVAGTLGVTSDFAVATSKFTVAAASGNTVVAGTLGVTGDFAVATSKFTVASATGNTAVLGDFFVNSTKFTVSATSGNTVVAGTLGVTGNADFSGYVGNPTYASQTTAWRVDSAGAADFRYLFVDEMYAKSFVADLEQALAGGQVITKSVAMVAQAFTVPALAGTATLWVRDLPSAPNMAAFESGDSVVLRSFSRAAGSLTITDCVGVVTAYADGSGANAGQQSWTFTRGTGANGGTTAAAVVIAVDAVVLDYGVTGNGYYEVSAVDGTVNVTSITRVTTTATVTTTYAHGYITGDSVNISGAVQSQYNGTFTITVTSATVFTYTVAGSPATPATGTILVNETNGMNAPYAQIVTWATSPIGVNRTLRTRFGNLRGVTGTNNEYGMVAGTYAATGGQYFRASNTAFELHGIDLLLWDGSTNTVKINHTVPSFALGNPVPTAYGTGTGIWMGKDTSYKFRVGDPAGNRVTWDGTDLTVVSDTVSIDTTGITVVVGTTFSVPDPSQSYRFNATNGNGTIYGLYGYEITGAQNQRFISLDNTGTNTTKLTQVYLHAKTDSAQEASVLVQSQPTASPGVPNSSLVQMVAYNTSFVVNSSGVAALTGSLTVSSTISERGRTTPIGEWINVTYAGGNFTASAGSWTVASGDQIGYRYRLTGKTMHLQAVLNNTDVTNAGGALLKLAIPGGFSAHGVVVSLILVKDNGTYKTGQAYAPDTATVVTLYADVTGNVFAQSTATTDVFVDIEIEIN